MTRIEQFDWEGNTVRFILTDEKQFTCDTNNRCLYPYVYIMGQEKENGILKILSLTFPFGGLEIR
jgi:hypothetical protein